MAACDEAFTGWVKNCEGMMKRGCWYDDEMKRTDDRPRVWADVMVWAREIKRMSE